MSCREQLCPDIRHERESFADFLSNLYSSEIPWGWAKIGEQWVEDSQCKGLLRCLSLGSHLWVSTEDNPLERPLPAYPNEVFNPETFVSLPDEAKWNKLRTYIKVGGIYFFKYRLSESHKIIHCKFDNDFWLTHFIIFETYSRSNGLVRMHFH